MSDQPRLAEWDGHMPLPLFYQRIHEEKFTGSYVTHCAQGVPVAIEIPSAPTRIRLDSRKGEVQT